MADNTTSYSDNVKDAARAQTLEMMAKKFAKCHFPDYMYNDEDHTDYMCALESKFDRLDQYYPSVASFEANLERLGQDVVDAYNGFLKKWDEREKTRQ